MCSPIARWLAFEGATHAVAAWRPVRLQAELCSLLIALIACCTREPKPCAPKHSPRISPRSACRTPRPLSPRPREGQISLQSRPAQVGGKAAARRKRWRRHIGITLGITLALADCHMHCLMACSSPYPHAGLLAALVEDVAELSSMQALAPEPGSESDTDWDFAQLDIGGLPMRFGTAAAQGRPAVPSRAHPGQCCAMARPAMALPSSPSRLPRALLTLLPYPATCRRPGDFLLETTNLRAAARAEVERALKRFLSPQRVLLRDKLTWCAGTLSMVGAAYWLGASPQ